MTTAEGTASPEAGAQAEDIFMIHGKGFNDSTLPIFSEVSEIEGIPKKLSSDVHGGAFKQEIQQYSHTDGNDTDETATASECEDEDMADRNELRLTSKYWFC